MIRYVLIGYFVIDFLTGDCACGDLPITDEAFSVTCPYAVGNWNNAGRVRFPISTSATSSPNAGPCLKP